MPAGGYSVDSWTVTVGGQPTGENYGTAQNIQVAATGDVDVRVTFKPQKYTLTYSASGDGTLTAKYNSADGMTVTSGTSLTAQTAIFFEAVPNEGYYIKSWSIGGQIIKDGAADYKGMTYPLAGLARDTDVVVTFAEIEYYTVSLAADGLGAVTHNAQVNADGKIESGSSFTITATPEANNGYQIAEWQIYDVNSYRTLQGNVGTYDVISLDKDLDIRVVFVSSVEYSVSFSADPDAGTVTAVSGSTTLTSGNEYPAYIPVTFTVTPNADYGVTGWTVNGTDQEGEHGTTFTLNALSGNTTVVAQLAAADTIDIAEIVVTVPVQGFSDVTTVETEQFTGTVLWSPTLIGGVFDWNTAYTATVTLTAKAGYTLTGVAENFFTVFGANSATNDANSGVVTAIFPTTEVGLPVITSANSAAVKQGSTFTVTATGRPTIQFSLENAPNGVAIGSFDGVLSVSASTAADKYIFTIKAENQAGTDTQSFTLTVSAVSSGPGIGAGTGGTTTPTQPTEQPTEQPPEQPTEPAQPDDPPETNTGGNDVVTPGDNPPVKNPDGSIELPDGGTVTTPDDKKVIVPPNSSIDKDGNITVGSGGGSISHSGGYTFNVPEGSVIIFDEAAPLGYYVDTENPFIDVKQDDWFYDNVMFSYSHGLLLGTGATIFSPNMPMTRAMLVTALWRMVGSPAGSGTPFSDVPAGQWYSEAVAWADANGIVLGIGGGLFAPNREITREQMAAILWRYAKFADAALAMDENPDISAYNDANNISAYAIDAVVWTVAEEIITGKPGGRLDPRGISTRAEVATVLRRFLEKQ
jgi:hypothetical protein